MIEFEWEQKVKRTEAAALLRELADSLASDGQLKIERAGSELKAEIPNELEIGIEVEVEDDETVLEIELKWSRKLDVMNEASLGATLRRVTEGASSKEAGLHVARWIGSQSPLVGLLPA